MREYLRVAISVVLSITVLMILNKLINLQIHPAYIEGAFWGLLIGGWSEVNKNGGKKN